MLFNSLDFLIFFALTAIAFFSIPERFRWALLLLASYVFYMSWEPAYTVLLAALTLFNYYAALRIARAHAVREKKTVLILSLLSNGGLLFLFKYLSFFSLSFQTLCRSLDIAVAIPVVSLALPVGISFYTLKIMNYTIDVYRGKVEPERRLGFFALYAAFFPQLIAGPIDRAAKLLPQFHEKTGFDYPRVRDGLALMLWGFFQKMVIADNLAVMVDKVYNNPALHGAPVLALASLLFTFQIYCDFSGYSDIAIGAARVFGYKSMQNFDRPYFSASIPEFWRRWHISLSTWFRDYLYIPLGGNRGSLPRWYMNLMIVFLVSGLWHGANWTFVAWGAIHGCFYVFSTLTLGVRERIAALTGLTRVPSVHKWLRVAITFCLVTFAWIFFRAPTLSHGVTIVERLVTGWGGTFGHDGARALVAFIRANFFEFSVGVVSVALMETVHLVQDRAKAREMFRSGPAWIRWPLYYGLIAAVLLFGSFGSRQFIYFQF